MSQKTAVIIGAGPAGLTAAWELLQQTDIKPIVFEQSRYIGGISKTVNYKGNRIDIGGHRFFSKSDRVMRWWLDMLPLQAGSEEQSLQIHYQGKQRDLDQSTEGPDPEQTDRVFLLRNRLSRIFYLRSFFDYPLSLGLQTIRNLGLWRMTRIGVSYAWASLFPIRDEKTLQDFFINRFGRELYLTFFKDYTEKVWGVPCTEIGADWGAQRIKGLSITKVLLHAIKRLAGGDRDSVAQKQTETSLIERFLYPKFGPGQLWETVAERVQAAGGEVRMGWRAIGSELVEGRIRRVRLLNEDSGESIEVEADYLFSTMPVRELIGGMGDAVPQRVRQLAGALEYRDFLTVGLLLKRLRVAERLPDNWIYIQERDVKVGRVQVFNNWSPYMVADPDTIWIGLEYFCNEGDALWQMDDEALQAFAVSEMEKIGFLSADDLLDATVIRQPKAYPGYFGAAYESFDEIRRFTDGIDNLFLIGRNGMHRYNNQDHSMLSAMVAVENIRDGVTDKANVWQVNTESEYHESK